MKSSWINNSARMLLGLLLVFPLLAQEEPKSEATAPELKKVVKQTRLAGDEAIAEIYRILRAFQPQEALVAIASTDIEDAEKALFTGWSFHQQGHYEEAVEQFDKVNVEDLKGEKFLLNRLDELRKSDKAVSEFEQLETENFIIYFQEGPDRVMTYYLPEVLESIYEAYSKLFHYEREEKILVELMPNHELFSYSSALSRKQIETTGTIALCVENRLVVMTPRRVLQGYEWPDTIAHEFVHYILTKKSRDNVPLWMQEGVAKYFEAQWRENDGSYLDPGMETSLAEAISKKSFLTVEQMMPSFAALPTAALARQAYAQTASMIDYLVERGGVELVQRLVENLRDEPNMDAVMTETLAMDFKAFEATWQNWAETRNYRTFETFMEHSVTLLDKDKNANELQEVNPEDDAAKKHTRLGDLLLERHRHQAALKEYRKTLTPDKKPPRQMALRILNCLQALDKAEEIMAFIESQTLFPERDPTMLSYLAEAHLRLDQRAEARALIQRAIYINPFNPLLFRTLLTTYDHNKDKEEVKRAQEILDILTKPRTKPAPKKESKS